MATTVTTGPGVLHVTSPAVRQVAAQPQDHPAKKFKNVFMTLGVMLVTAGILSFILGGVGLSPSVTGTYIYVGTGMWGGGWYIASGALAISTAVRPNACNVIGGMVVSILTSLVAFGVGVSEAVIAGLCDITNLYYSYSTYCQGAFIGIHGTVAALAFISMILAIVHSSYCCCGGCGQSNYQGQVLTTTTVTAIPTMQVPVQQTYVTGQPVGQAYYPQGPQFGAYPPTQTQAAFTASPSAGYGIQPQAQAPYAPPPYAQEQQQKPAFQ